MGIAFLLDVAFMAGYAPVTGLHLGLVVLSIGMLPLIWALPRLRAADYSAVWQQRVLEGMSDAVLVADGDGRIASANRAAQRLLTAGSGRDRMGASLADYPWLAELGYEAAEADADSDAASAAVGRTVSLRSDDGTRTARSAPLQHPRSRRPRAEPCARAARRDGAGRVHPET